MEIQAPVVRKVRVVHSITGSVLFEAGHPRLGQIRVFQLKRWTWDKVRTILPEGYTLFNVELIHSSRTINSFRALMSLTDEEVLEVGYVIKELQTPSPRVRRDMTEAISRHQPELIWNYLSKYKVPELLRVIRGETMSPLSLLLWVPYLVVEDARRCPRALESLLAARSPNQLGSPARAPLSIAVEVNDQESVEELLSYRADPNIASEAGGGSSALRCCPTSSQGYRTHFASVSCRC